MKQHYNLSSLKYWINQTLEKVPDFKLSSVIRHPKFKSINNDV